MRRPPIRPPARRPPSGSSGSSRRDFLRALAGAGAALALPACDPPPSTVAACCPGPDDAGLPLAGSPTDLGGMTPPPPRTRRTRGIILTIDDLSLADWPDRAAAAGLNTLSLHCTQRPSSVMVPFIQSAAGQRFLDRCAALGLDVEYEMHSMADLMPTELFASRPQLFRANESCVRVPDGNLCVHTREALEVAADSAIALARALVPTTSRYFLWPDDGANWCQCACCAPISFSDQQLTLNNFLLPAIRSVDSKATLAHLAYLQTMPAPVYVKPVPGVFLEFCPILRRYDEPLDTPGDPMQKSYLDALDDNLAVFPAAEAKALEFWLDVSRHSGWTRPAQKLPFVEENARADVRTYHARGVRDISTFAVWIDADYLKRFGDPPVAAYASAVAQP